MIDYTDFLSDDDGVLPSRGSLSFNNIVFSTELLMGKRLLQELCQQDIELMLSHIDQTVDGHGLYKPKNSHDNILMKIFVLRKLILNTNSIRIMNWKEAIKGKHPRDIILFSYLLGNGIVKRIAKLLLFIPALMMIQSVSSDGKIRPKMFEKKGNGKTSRWKWWFLPKKLVSSDEIGRNKYVKKWIDIFGNTRTSFHMQNDGKILTKYRLMLLKDESKIMSLCAKICKRIYIRKMGRNWKSELYKNYFPESDHPVRLVWDRVDGKGIEVL